MAYTFQTIDNTTDPTFNQLLSINEAGIIAGYYGSGATGHPNKGYLVTPNYTIGHFKPLNYPLSAQTQVTGINDANTVVGFEIDAAGNSYGFVDINGVFSIAVDPLAPVLNGVVSEQFLGLNDHGQIAGFYVRDLAGDAAGFVYNLATNSFAAVTVAGAASVTATDVNNHGQVSGFFTASGKTEGFVDTKGTIVDLAGPAGATDVQALGLNDTGLVVGSFVDAKGHTDGFVYNSLSGVYTTIIKGNGTQTVVNGVNDEGDLVGFYMDAAGNTHGMLLTPPAPTLVWQFKTIDNTKDPTFNQLLSINNNGLITGYFGSGATGHPNRGYFVVPPYGQANFVSENYPGSVQTQVTGVNNMGVTVGFEIDAAGNSLGWVQQNGRFSAAVDPNAPTLSGVVNEQYLGVNDLGMVAGFYVADAPGDTAGFIYNSNSGGFTAVKYTGATSLTATDINDKGQISGFLTLSGKTEGFIDTNGHFLLIPGGAGDSNVQVLGLNNNGLAVGSFQNSSGTHGFVYTESTGAFDIVNAPGAVGETVLNGVNDLDKVVGFYMDKLGNTHGLLLTSG